MAAIAYPAPISAKQRGHSVEFLSPDTERSRPQLVVLVGGRDASGRRSVAERRRIRRLVFQAALVVVVAIGLPSAVTIVGDLASAMGDQPAVTSTSGTAVVQVNSVGQYRVVVGDSMWSIATAIAGDRDVRSIVAKLSASHGGPSIQAGELLDLSSVLPR